MKLVTRNFNRPTTFLPGLWNDFFADDLFAKYPSKRQNKSCVVNANWQHNVPAVNIKNREEHYFIELAAPGYKKSDFAVELEDGVLTISAKKEKNEETKEDGYTHREFSSSTFKRSFTVPEDSVDVERIEASYEAGVLVISIPKKEKEETKMSIDIS